MPNKDFREGTEEFPPIDTLVEVLIHEVTNHFKIGNDTVLYRLMHWFMRVPSERFAALMQRFDQMVAEKSIWEAARDALPQFTDGLNFKNNKIIPKEGPLLVVANHPGVADFVAVMACIERKDQYILANERPMLSIMPNASRHMLLVDVQNPHRLDIMHRVINYLHNGKTVIIFPRGNLEPDPALYSGALESLKNWSQSIGVFLSKVPETVLQPLLISNVVAPKAWRSLISTRARSIKTRHQIAMILQAVMQRITKKGGWRIPVYVKAAPWLSAYDLAPNLDVNALNQAVMAYMGDLLKAEFPEAIS